MNDGTMTLPKVEKACEHFAAYSSDPTGGEWARLAACVREAIDLLEEMLANEGQIVSDTGEYAAKKYGYLTMFERIRRLLGEKI